MESRLPVAERYHPAAVASAAREENFPVALRVLPRTLRRHLLAVYAVARLIDDVGDSPVVGDIPIDLSVEGDPRPRRLAALDRLEDDLRRVWSDGRPETPVFAALVPTATACALTPEPFLALVEANRVDQSLRRISSYDELRGYCRLSADPVGRIVLQVFGASTRQRAEWSDDVCTALQILEHCQDVREDLHERDRVYLPADNLTACGVVEADLLGETAPPRLRRAIAVEVDRAAELLGSGRPLVRSLRGWARLAIAGYVAGGLATVDAIRRVDHDVLGHAPKPRRRDVARHVLVLLGEKR